MSKNAVKKTKKRDRLEDIRNDLKSYNALNGTDYEIMSGQEKMLWTMKTIMYTQQKLMDAVFIALNKTFGFSEQRNKKFHDGFEAVYDVIRDMQRKDDDEEEVYFKTKVEDALKIACGKYYQPREYRYSFTITDATGRKFEIKEDDCNGF